MSWQETYNLTTYRFLQRQNTDPAITVDIKINETVTLTITYKFPPLPGFSFLASCTRSSFGVAASVGFSPVLCLVDEMSCSVASLVVGVPFVVSRGLVVVCSSVVTDKVVEEAFVNGNDAFSLCLVMVVIASEVGLLLTFVAGVVGFVVVFSDGVVVAAVVVLLLLLVVLEVALLPLVVPLIVASVDGNVPAIAVEPTVGVVTSVFFVVLPIIVGAMTYT